MCPPLRPSRCSSPTCSRRGSGSTNRRQPWRTLAPISITTTLPNSRSVTHSTCLCVQACYCCQGPCNGHMLGQSSTCGQGYSPDSIGLNQSAGFRQAAQCAQRRQRVGANEMLTVRLEVSDIHCARAQEQARWGERDSGERAHTGQVQAEARRQARCTRGQREGCCLAAGPSERPALHLVF